MNGSIRPYGTGLETQYIAMALTLFHVNMTSCKFYEYSLHGALRMDSLKESKTTYLHFNIDFMVNPKTTALTFVLKYTRTSKDQQSISNQQLKL